jgi:hypothetical protein
VDECPLGDAVTPLLIYACLTAMTWRQAFLVFGLAGVAWAVVFAWWARRSCSA